MTDTPREIYLKQMEILMSKTIVERIRLLSNYSDFMKQNALIRIKNENPWLNDKEVMDIFIFQQFGAGRNAKPTNKK